jgi:hypothetical protein
MGMKFQITSISLSLSLLQLGLMDYPHCIFDFVDLTPKIKPVIPNILIYLWFCCGWEEGIQQTTQQPSPPAPDSSASYVFRAAGVVVVDDE